MNSLLSPLPLFDIGEYALDGAQAELSKRVREVRIIERVCDVRIFEGGGAGKDDGIESR